MKEPGKEFGGNMNIVDATCSECGQPMRWEIGTARTCQKCTDIGVETEEIWERLLNDINALGLDKEV